MKSKLKALGLSFVAVFAMTAVAATAAQAAEFHSESATTFVTGENVAGTEDTFTITSPQVITVKCTISKFTGTISGTTVKDVTLHPDYSKGTCKLNNLAATVTVPAACNYTFTNTGATTVTTDVVGCPAETPIKVVAVGCTLEISNQTGLNTITLTNTGEGAARDIDAEIAVGGITAKRSAGCPGGAGTTTTADYVGKATLRGYSNAGHTTQTGIWYS